MPHSSPQSSQTCTQCNNPMQAGQRFCSNCGAVTQAPLAPTIAASTSPDSPSTPSQYLKPTVMANPPSNTDGQQSFPGYPQSNTGGQLSFSGYPQPNTG